MSVGLIFWFIFKSFLIMEIIVFIWSLDEEMTSGIARCLRGFSGEGYRLASRCSWLGCLGRIRLYAFILFYFMKLYIIIKCNKMYTKSFPIIFFFSSYDRSTFFLIDIVLIIQSVTLLLTFLIFFYAGDFFRVFCNF